MLQEITPLTKVGTSLSLFFFFFFDILHMHPMNLILVILPFAYTSKGDAT